MKAKKVVTIGTAVAVSVGFGFLLAQHSMSRAEIAQPVELAPAASLELPKALVDLGIPDARVTKRFDTEVAGLDGYVVQAGGDSNLVYTLDDGRYAVIGLLLGEGGRNLSEEHATAHLNLAALDPTKKLPQRESAAGDSKKALAAVQGVPFTIEEGTGETIVYVTLDPNCPHCANYYRAARSVVDEVTFRWIPVGFLGPESMRQAALLVESDDPLAAVAQMQNAVLEGKPSEQSYETIYQNTMSLRDAGLTMTPVSVYVYKDGSHKVVRGALNAAQIRNLAK